MATLNQNENPYVGPRTFQPEDRAKFFGRSREARDLTALIISNRLVLFYSPSGAGKSSLLNTMVRPMLAEAGFELLPTGRVSGYSGADVSAQNIFSYNLLLSLQESEKVVADFTGLTISQFLDNLIQTEDGVHRYDPAYVYPSDTVFKPRVLIIDQFEELITTNTALWPQRTDFFEQLAEAMRLDEQLWVVLTLREDYAASFDPYLHLMPSRVRHRYYMERLARSEAIEAMQRPVAHIRPFTPEAIELLADNLLHLPAADEQSQTRFAQFVEPVQLQAVCYQMWEGLNQQPGAVITAEDVARFADVTKALTSFYDDTIKQTTLATGVAERALRNWFENELVTEAGTRSMVYRGQEMTGNLPTRVADYVRSQFILTDVVRSGGMWYELVHDRFVDSVLTANHDWRQKNPLTTLPTHFEHGYAVLIGVSGNQIPRLALPVCSKDVQAMYDVLTHPQRCAYKPENVKLLKDQVATKENIFASLRWLKKVAEEDKEATTIIYYSGHGMADKATNQYYIVPSDILQLSRIKEDAVKAEDMSDGINAIRAKRMLVIFDCDHAEAMTKNINIGVESWADAPLPSRESSVIKNGAHRLQKGYGRVIFNSSKADQSGYVRKDGQMSIFTYHLIESITGHASPSDATTVFITDMIKWLAENAEKTAKELGRVMTPVFRVSGDFPVALLLGGEGIGESLPDPLAALPSAVDAHEVDILLNRLFADLAEQIIPRDPSVADKIQSIRTAVATIRALRNETNRRIMNEDMRMANLIKDIVTAVPESAQSITALFSNPVIARTADGPATEDILKRVEHS